MPGKATLLTLDDEAGEEEGGILYAILGIVFVASVLVPPC